MTNMGEFGQRIIPSVRKGVQANPMFEIEVDHYVPPILHLEIGLINDIVENLKQELQAGMESYTDAYCAAERVYFDSLFELETAKQEFSEFVTGNSEYEKELKQYLREAHWSDEDKDHFKVELEFLKNEKNHLRDKRSDAKIALANAKTLFQQEQEDPANSKHLGQPVGSEVENILKRLGADRGVYHGGKLQGRGCRILMSKHMELQAELNTLVLYSEAPGKEESNEQLLVCVEQHCRLLGHLDAYFALLRIDRYKVTLDDIEKLKAHKMRAMNLVRSLKISFTPKFHTAETHAVDLYERWMGYGELAEDAGEKMHQNHMKQDWRIAAITDYGKRVNTKEKFDARARCTMVKKEMARIESMYKRKRAQENATTEEDRQQQRHQLRNELLELDELETVPTLRENKKIRIMNNNTQH